MDWITKGQVIMASEDKMSALKMSLKHHEQGRDCTRGELVDAIDGGLWHLGQELCACCEKAGMRCFKCELSTTDKGVPSERCCDGAYLGASGGRRAFIDNPNPTNFRAFQEAESKVCDYIQGVIDAETAKDDKPKLRHGDYGRNSSSPRLFACNYDGDLIPYHASGQCGTKDVDTYTEQDYTLLGNIFDDIKNKGKELKKFEVVTAYSSSDDRLGCYTGCYYGGGMGVQFGVKTKGTEVVALFTVDEAQEICDKLQQVINKAKNK